MKMRAIYFKRSTLKFLAIPLIFCSLLFAIQFWRIHSRSESCLGFFNRQKFPVPILLIDLRILTENQECQDLSKIQIAVDSEYRSIISNEMDLFQNFEVIFYEDNSEKDYLKFDSDVKRIIPKKFEVYKIGNVQIPADPELFGEFWRRSKYQECLGLDMKRNPNETREIDLKLGITSLADFRNLLVKHRMFPFLGGGTLLGWYRECSVIPHTTDMDMIVPIEQYNPSFLEEVLAKNTSFYAYRKLGMVNDSLEITVVPKSSAFTKPFTLDVFFMYEDVAENGTKSFFVTGIDADLSKLKYSYPFYDAWCSVDLHGHIFWATCSPDQILSVEYGENWRMDHPTNRFSWSSSHKNVQPNGKFSMDQKDQVYVFYW